MVGLIKKEDIMHRYMMDLAILLALAGGDKHGYGIYKQLLEDCRSGEVISDWSVYRALPRLMKLKRIEIIEPTANPIIYRLTRPGKSWLSWEQARLERIGQLAKQRLRL